MERVAFLIEESGERLSCMLNPESLVVRRNAGIRPQQSVNGSLTGSSLSDDPLLFTGGGRTELQLDLLFDVHIAGTTLQTSDVRDLTAPLWRLAENTPDAPEPTAPLARFVWGKSWNILGVVASVAERFENFTAAGEPQRSWLRMRFIRVTEPEAAAVDLTTTDLINAPDAADAAAATALLGDLADAVPGEIAGINDIAAVHELTGEGTTGENLPYLAYVYLDDPAQWRWLAWFNGIIDPLRLAAGTLINVPTAILRQRSPKP